MRLLRWPTAIAGRLTVLIGGLSLLTGLLCFTLAYLQVRRVTLAGAGKRLHDATFLLESQLRMQVRTFERRAHGTARRAAVQEWLANPGPARARAALAVLQEAHASDTTSRAWLLVSPRGDTLVVGAAPFGLSARDSLVALAGARRDSLAFGGLREFQGTLVYPVVLLLPAGRGRMGLLVHWRRSVLSPRTGMQLRNLVGEGTRLLLGTPGMGWMTLQGPTAAPEMRGGLRSDAFIHTDATLGRRLMAARPIRGTPWIVGLDLPLSLVREPIARFANLMLVALAGLAALALVAAWVQSNRLTRPVRELLGATRAMVEHDYSNRVTASGPDELAQLAVAFNAMAERVEDEVLARRRSEQQWHVLFANSPLPMWVYDCATLRFLAVNDAAVACYGYNVAEFRGMTIRDLQPPDDSPTPREARTVPPPDDQPATFRHRTRNGAVVEMELRSRATSFSGREARLVIAQDVTRRARVEAELRQAQKMEAIGRLAAGVAHDFNNALAVIMTHTELIQSELSEGEQRRRTDEILSAGRSAHSLTRQLLAFSSQQVVRPRELDLCRLVKGIEGLVRPLLGARVELVLDLSSRGCAVMADPAQIEQVLINLVINARDAMPAGGTLTIRAGCASLDDAGAALRSLPPGEYGLVEVRDTGVGMSAAVQSRIFEPFFTTKGEGKGTGLGLPSAYGIVRQAGGGISVDSAPDRGSVFTVYLPRIHGSAPEGESRAAPVAAAALTRGSETILVAEDEPAVRSAVTGILKRLGYTVLAAANADEALALAQAHEGPLHLLVSDVVMPGLTGPALLRKLREQRPDIRALFTSGYAGESIREHGLNDPGIPFLEKPFTMQALAHKVREALH